MRINLKRKLLYELEPVKNDSFVEMMIGAFWTQLIISLAFKIFVTGFAIICAIEHVNL